jgi:hypothetical protein
MLLVTTALFRFLLYANHVNTYFVEAPLHYLSTQLQLVLADIDSHKIFSLNIIKSSFVNTELFISPSGISDPCDTRCNACRRNFDYTVDICRVTKGAHIEHLLGRTETWSVSPSVDMLPFGVTIPATVPQWSEIPEGLMNNPVLVNLCTTRINI